MAKTNRSTKKRRSLHQRFMYIATNSDYIEAYKKEYDKMSYQNQLRFHADFVPYKHQQLIELSESIIKANYFFLRVNAKNPKSGFDENALLTEIKQQEMALRRLKSRWILIRLGAQVAKDLLNKLVFDE